MTYEQLEVYFGPPGSTVIIPISGERLSPQPHDLNYQRVLCIPGATTRTQWTSVFQSCRMLAKHLRTAPGVPKYDALVLRTGILCPKNREGEAAYGNVLVARIDMSTHIGPGQITFLFATHGGPSPTQVLVPDWMRLPAGIPYPEWEKRVPNPLKHAWFMGFDKLSAIAQSVQPAVLGLDVWEELL